MRRIRSISIVCLLLGAAVGIYMLGQTLNHHRYSGDVVEELMYFPSGRLLKISDLGFDTLASDMLWLKGIQYYGQHRKTDKHYPLAEHVFSVITDLDPHFLGAYRFGAFVLAQDMGQPALGIELLKKGMHNNPNVWQMPFDLGFLHFLTVKDNMRAAHYFRLASRFEDSPDIAKRFTAFAYKKAGRIDVARALWQEIWQSSPNRVMRETAELAIMNIDLERNTGLLTQASHEFYARYGRYPKTLQELVDTGFIQRIPFDPFGGKYFLDRATGEALSTTRVRAEASIVKCRVERIVSRYFEKVGRYPESLSVLVEEGMIDVVPEVAGTRIIYNPVEGLVDYVLVLEETNEWEGVY